MPGGIIEDPLDLDQKLLPPEERSPLRPGWVKYAEEVIEEITPEAQTQQAPEEPEGTHPQ